MRLSDDKILIGTLALSLAVIFPDSPGWVSIFTAVVLVYRLCSDVFGWIKLSRWTTSALALGLFTLVIFQYRTFMSQEASTSLLMGLTALKIVDFSNQRDRQILILLGFLMVSLKPLYNFDFYWLVPLIICMAGLWWSLLSTSQPRAIRFLFFLFLQSIPATILLFFVFPRVVMPWATSRATERGIMGFSDRLVPGRIAELTGTDRLVFRAEFSSPQRINVQELYWRGVVLNRSQGLHWFSEFNGERSASESFDGGLTYRIIQGEEYPTFLFGLETPLEISSSVVAVKSYRNFIYRSINEKKSSIAYKVRSDFDFKNTTEPTLNDKQVPKLTPIINSWVEKTKKENSTSGERLKALQHFFSKSGFAYTRTPGTYADDGLEDFLFRRRRGFCEHFAGSYATLARALEIPARVVVGFQGGLFNAVGGFWQVNMLDAHAWVEVYNEGYWQRVDPSAWIAPLRIQLGAFEFFNLSLEDQQRLEAVGLGQQDWGWAVLAWRAVMLYYDNLNYRWTSFIVDYDATSQKGILDEIRPNMPWIFLGLFFVFLVSFVLLKVGFTKKQRLPLLEKLFFDIEKVAAAKKIIRTVGETPLQYLARLNEQLKGEKDFLRKFSCVYDLHMYAQQNQDQEIQALLKDWRSFKKSILSR